MRTVMPPRGGGTARGLGVVLAGVTMAVAAALAIHGCDNHVQPFQCGVRLDGDQNVVRVCDGPNEVCICWTHYCARKEPPSGTCESGYRYRRDPFGPKSEGGAGGGMIDSDLGECVPKELSDWRIEGTQFCAEQDAGMGGAGGGTGGAGGGTGGTGGETGGTGGATGGTGGGTGGGAGGTSGGAGGMDASGGAGGSP